MKRVFGYFDAAGKVVAGISALVVLASGIVGLVFVLLPNAKPSVGPSTVLAINKITSQGTITFKEYMLFNEQSATNHEPGQLGTVGHYYELKLTLRGLQKKDVVVLWTLYSAGNDSPIVRPHWINQSATTVRPVADTAEQVARVWIQQPTFRGLFYARVEIDVGKTTLDSERTELFRGLPARVEPIVRPSSIITLPLAPRTKTSGCTRGPLPDRACSPGAYYSQRTKDVICARDFHTRAYGYTPAAVRSAVEAEYGINSGFHGTSLEIDHIIPLGLGGSNDIANLFAEAASPRPGYREKDLVENHLEKLVCSDKMTLAAAQRAIATDWVAIYNTIK